MANVRYFGGGAVDLGTKNIIENGTYNASSDGLDGYSQVTVNVPEKTLGTKSIITNGTYNASSDNLDGYSQVTVNVPTGIPKMSRADWNALSTEEKQALQYVAIQDSNSGFVRGDLVYGSAYMAPGVYIPYSDADSVLCEAYIDNFNPNMLIWGGGDYPVTLTGRVAIDPNEDAVYIPVSTSGVLAYIDLLSNNTPFTAYVVMKASTPGSYSRLISSMASRSSGKGILMYGSTISVSSWGSDSSLGVPSTNYFAGVIQYGGSGSAKGGILNNIVSKSPTNSGRYITLGRTDIDPNTSNAEPCNVYVRYIAVTNSVDSDTIINNNLTNLVNNFIS